MELIHLYISVSEKIELLYFCFDKKINFGPT